MSRRGQSWLCPSDMDRARLVDMNLRAGKARRVQGLALGVVALAATPWTGWWLAVLVVLAGVVLLVLERAMPAARAPQRLSLASIVVLDLVLGAAAAGTGGARSPFAAWLLVPTVMLAARFRPRVVVMGVAGTALLGAAAFGYAAARPSPPVLPLALVAAAWVGLVLGVVAAVMALLAAELSSRDEAVVDALTGLYNRTALVGRFAQTAEQARVLDGWLSVIMCDLDHFKDVNDTYGHDVGDQVLRAVAAQMRATLRSFDMVYRYGGEEFLILLPGQDPAAAEQIAERLRAAVAEVGFAGFHVTLSCGFASARGSDLDLDVLVHQADQALYRAKTGGRNRVVGHHRAGDVSPAAKLVLAERH